MQVKFPVKEVMRNKTRILNHAELLRAKIDIGRRMGIFAEGADMAVERPELIEKCLMQFKAKKITAVEVLQIINSSVSARISEAEFTAMTATAYQAGLVEMHLTDKCNCRCPRCYYGSNKKDVFPFEKLDRVAEMRPRAIVLVGGGEPTVYRSRGKHLADAMDLFGISLPGVQFGLITNGIIMPPEHEKVTSMLNWTRLSIDAATQQTYAVVKGKDVHDISRTFSNLETYLESPVPFVGAGFLFSSLNVFESADFLRRVFLIVSKSQERMDKINVQFRPMRPSTEYLRRVAIGKMKFEFSVKRGQLKDVMARFKRLKAGLGAGFTEFVETRTNFAEVFKGNTKYSGAEFDFCSFPLLYRLVRASGAIYPCFVCVDPEKQENIMGNILTDEDYMMRVGLLSYLYAAKIISFCTKDGCRLSRNNNIVSEAVRTGVFQRPVGPASENYFF